MSKGGLRCLLPPHNVSALGWILVKFASGNQLCTIPSTLALILVFLVLQNLTGGSGGRNADEDDGYLSYRNSRFSNANGFCSSRRQ